MCTAAAATVSAPWCSLLRPSPPGDCARPTVVGDPVVGNVLSVTFTTKDTATSTDTTGFDGLYRWQSCDPAVAECSASSAHDDDNWTNLPASDPIRTTTRPTRSFPQISGHFIRVLTHENSSGSKWRASDPVGPVTVPPKAAVPPPPLEPEHGISFLVQPAGGTVTVKAPGQSEFTHPGRAREDPGKQRGRYAGRHRQPDRRDRQPGRHDRGQLGQPLGRPDPHRAVRRHRTRSRPPSSSRSSAARSARGARQRPRSPRGRSRGPRGSGGAGSGAAGTAITRRGAAAAPGASGGPPGSPRTPAGGPSSRSPTGSGSRSSTSTWARRSIWVRGRATSRGTAEPAGQAGAQTLISSALPRTGIEST